MARIKDYELDRELEVQDRVLGTDYATGDVVNFSMEQIAELFASRGLADPSALDFQFSFAGQGTPLAGVQPGEIYYDELTPDDITTITISSTDIKGEPTGPFVSILQGTVIELNDTQASQGTNYGFFNVADDGVALSDESGYSIGISVHPDATTEDLPTTEYINLGAIGLAGAIGVDGFTPVITQPTPGEFHVEYERTQNPTPTDVDIPPGVPGNSIGASTSTDTLANPNTHTVTFTSTDGNPPAPITISDGAIGPGTEAIAAGSYAVAVDGTVTLTKENSGGNVIITGIGTGTSPSVHNFSTSVNGPTSLEGQDGAQVPFPDQSPAGGSGFTYNITSVINNDTANWTTAIETGNQAFSVAANAGVFGSVTVSVIYEVTDNNQMPPTIETLPAREYTYHTFRGTFIGSQYPAPQSYTMPTNDRGRLTSGQTYAFSRPGTDDSINWHALVAIPSEVATPGQLRFNDGGFLTIPGNDVDHWGDIGSTYTLFYFEIPGTETNYETTITF